MSVEKLHDAGQTLSPPLGKVLGVVNTRDQLRDVVEGLKEAGFTAIKVLEGDEGATLLERSQGVFWGDAEGPVLQRMIEELKAGHFAFSIQTPSADSSRVAEIASALGARFLVHFGLASVTWLKE